MSAGGKLTVFMAVLIVIFVAIRWLLLRVLGAYPQPTKHRPSDVPPMESGGVDPSVHPSDE